MNRIRFVLVGDGKDRERSMNLVREKKLQNVHWAGVVSKTGMKEVLAAADACLAILMNIPMFRTVYPNKVFDYMAAGRPTILGIDGVIRDVVEASGGGVFFTPGDDEALAIVSDMAGDQAGCVRMGRDARTYVANISIVMSNRDVPRSHPGINIGINPATNPRSSNT